MIYITGDTHGKIDFKKLEAYFKNEYVSNKDYLIILGDAGIVWSQKEMFISDYSMLGLTVFYIDGNHENFDLLNTFPILTKNGAKCHLLSKNVYHIMRGEILKLNDLLFLCIGGATSIDKFFRIEGKSWWNDEHITDFDISNALDNLKKYNYNVDYVISHCAPSEFVNMLGFEKDNDTDQLSRILKDVIFKKWYFGHYHLDIEKDNFRCFYNNMLRIESYDIGKKNIFFNLLVREDDEIFLRNWDTGRITKIKEEDLPEWYYHNYTYKSWYYNLKGIKDIAFIGSPFDNHISKDSSFYLSYHGRLRKDQDSRPIDEDKWDSHTWRCDIVSFINGVDKYSPNVKTDKIKAQINLVYDQYNGGSFFNMNNSVYVRPFPYIKTPIYKERYSKKEAEYEVTEGNIILSQFIDLERAKEYAKVYVTGNLRISLVRTIIGGDSCDYIEAYDTSYDTNKWVYLRRIRK